MELRLLLWNHPGDGHSYLKGKEQFAKPYHVGSGKSLGPTVTETQA